jgi:transposase
MGEVKTIGLDIAKSVFQIHGVDAGGAVVIRKRITRPKLLEFFAALPSCLVGIEACPTAHYWGRQLQTLGHAVKLLPPSYVKAYLKRSKNDANDAAAICEAVTRANMRFVPTKTLEQQSCLMLHPITMPPRNLSLRGWRHSFKQLEMSSTANSSQKKETGRPAASSNSDAGDEVAN